MSSLARPYIRCLTSLSLVIWLSLGPRFGDIGSDGRLIIDAKASGAIRLALARSIQLSSSTVAFPDQGLEPLHRASGVSQAGHSCFDGSNDQGIVLAAVVASRTAPCSDPGLPLGYAYV